MKRSLLVCLVLASAAHTQPGDKVLFDFKNPADIAVWSNLVLPDAKDKEPPIQIERSDAGMKLIFAGGRWPTITTKQIPDDWLTHQSFEADVIATRPCVVGFTVLQEKSQRGDGWDPTISRWTKTAFLQPGVNHIVGTLRQPNDYSLHAKWGKVVAFEFFLYAPHKGETITLSNLRLTNTKTPPPEKKRFTVAGLDETFTGVSSANAVIEMGKKFKDQWKKPEPKSLDDHESEFRAAFAELKKSHPKARLAILRDGEKGYDPADPDRAYAGWTDAYFNSHGPDGMTLPRSENRGTSATHEVFMRHRSPLMKLDLSSIPARADVLAAKLVIVRANDKFLDDHNPEKKATMWVVEPCLRPWNETEVNAYEFAKDKFWKTVGGMQWDGDADFAPIFLAHGPGSGKINVWNFTHALRYWQTHPNHGFMLHGDSHDYITAFTREAKTLRDRPAVMVIYE